MIRQFFNPKHLWLGLFSMILIIILWQTTVSANTPSQIRVGQFIPNTDLTVEIKPQFGEESPTTLSNLSYKQISDYQSLAQGRYTFTVQSDDQILLQTTYGLGKGDRYTLALYGIISEPFKTNPLTFMAQLKRILGGVEADAVNGYLPQMRLIHDKVSNQTKYPQIRLINLASGIVPLNIKIQGQSKSLFSKTLAYPKASEVESIRGEATAIIISDQSRTSALYSQPITLKPEICNDIFVIGGLTANNPVEARIAI